ncbi:MULTISPECIES: 2-amino-4-hydroxy-6-hydroxymethyldihydropteridine diphosphokinase [unclassified Ectothiorhodospira]|uniref:2-amino-4-hydroxy-6- hydroxymethyldihydropteridine diphosphokinase n=1 Tax=unclassified Ectothiorhodospira TaxID=2684909 RepID=UPI001EE974A5|nr:MULTISPECIES: 2-amino-4-hydroxy-6-hydroxymethyldihydropteridine diphosphokinase [unclassified Ectothiorhodospira]MCG5516336.1 2-amino-4-hydroxy-6-hydroxymethyldihydropteridine diphosphokinase [Ectothiorhodospira sp. 9100]MCG5518398.1 2-amino-4-hydroxy-6-hydroxymethyldihydropteridine diphosphokinase [Ectothiorhodospira sp. 9905]
MNPVIAYVGLGANLDDPIAHVSRALEELCQLPDTRQVSRSALYRSDPMGPPDQPDYINAVCALSTRLSAEALLDALRALEAQHGRLRDGTRWGPRTLDLDILLYGDESIQEEHLKIPHPGMAERAFVLYPLAEIAPDLSVPGLGALQELLKHCPGDGLQPLSG